MTDSDRAHGDSGRDRQRLRLPASDLSSHITEQEIVVDGGYSVGSNVNAGTTSR
jgi:hypothetical protein